MAAVNDALRFYVGREYRVHTRAGDVIVGRCAMVATDRITLVSPVGMFTPYTGQIRLVDNLTAQRA